ncbi:MAG: hypothetical protein ACI4O8_02045 [Aristaeellaceae bacterium]
MANPALLNGFNIANVEHVTVTTHDDVPVVYHYRTMSSFDAESKVSEGEEKTLRIKNRIMGRLKYDDIQEGYDLDCEDGNVIPEILALVDGGNWDADAKKYSAPVIGTEVERKVFDMDIYTSNRDASGAAQSYLKWHFPNCKGKPIAISAKDDDFTNQKYKIESRAGKGQSPFEVEIVEELPAVTES